MYNLRENTQRTFQVGSRFPMVTNGCWYCLTLPYLREISWIGRVEIADSMTVLVDKTRTTCTYPSPAPGFTSDVFCKTRTTCTYPSPAPGVTSDVLCKTRTSCNCFKLIFIFLYLLPMLIFPLSICYFNISIIYFLY